MGSKNELVIHIVGSCVIFKNLPYREDNLLFLVDSRPWTSASLHCYLPLGLAENLQLSNLWALKYNSYKHRQISNMILIAFCHMWSQVLTLNMGHTPLLNEKIEHILISRFFYCLLFHSILLVFSFSQWNVFTPFITLTYGSESPTY